MRDFDALCELNQGPTFLAICKKTDDAYVLNDYFDAKELAQIICLGAFREIDFSKSAYLCVWAEVGYKKISDAEAKAFKTEEELRAYIEELIEEDAIDYE